MRKAPVIFLAATMVVILAAGPAAASIATSNLFNGVVNKLEDTDYESYWDNSSTPNTVLDVGDVLYGMWEVQKVTNTVTAASVTNFPDWFTAVFALEVATKSGSYDWTFKAVSDADWNAVFATGTNTQLARSDSDSAILVFSDPDQINPTLGGSAQSAVGSVNGTALWEFGFDSSGEYWSAASNFDDFTTVNINSTLTYHAGLNVTHDYGATGWILLPHDYLFAGTDYQLQLTGGMEWPPTGNFDFATDTDLYVYPVPEPASVLVWSLMLAVAGIAAWRKRRA